MPSTLAWNSGPVWSLPDPPGIGWPGTQVPVSLSRPSARALCSVRRPQMGEHGEACSMQGPRRPTSNGCGLARLPPNQALSRRYVNTSRQQLRSNNARFSQSRKINALVIEPVMLLALASSIPWHKSQCKEQGVQDKIFLKASFRHNGLCRTATHMIFKPVANCRNTRLQENISGNTEVKKVQKIDKFTKCVSH